MIAFWPVALLSFSVFLSILYPTRPPKIASRFSTNFAIFMVFFATEINANKIDFFLFASQSLLIKINVFEWCFSLNTPQYIVLQE
ncbi:hypothetical protein AAW26_03020 [Vibrio alginolyticus]|nr:hypothetical protein AAW26_03020 [Vibrio alginolyticus]